MKKQDEKLVIKSLDEFEELVVEYKGKRVELHIEKSLFIGESKEFFDEEIYNEFEYVLEMEEIYFFALSREIIEEILEKCLEENVKLKGIYLIDELSLEINSKNFLREEYIQQKKESILKKEEKIAAIIFFIVLFIVVSFFQISKIKISNKVQLEKEKLNYNYEKIKKLETVLIENSLEEKEHENLYFVNNKKVSTILSNIEKALENINIERIEINGRKLKVKGTAKKLEEIYKFEKKLYENFENINNDFIKKENFFYKFIFDFTIKE